MNIVEISLVPATPGSSRLQTLVANTSANSLLSFNTEAKIIVTPENDTYFRMTKTTDNSACTNDGTDQLLLARNTYRIHPIPAGYRLVYNCPSGGRLWETPEA
jgi:hypothetical protein